MPAQPALTSTLANKPATRIPRTNAANNKLSLLPGSILALQDENVSKVNEEMEIEALERVPEEQAQTSTQIISDDEGVDKVEDMVRVEYRGPDLHANHRPRTPAHSPSPATSPVRLISSPVRSPEPESIHDRPWPAPPSPRTRAELQRIKDNFVDDSNIPDFDTTLVAEYSEEIFEYMSKLETECMPGERYMEGQTEITWEMRQTLVDWLLQLHLRYGLLPETLWIAINIVDRFLTKRVVSLVKLQLVGVTAMFIAAKYEEILAPRFGTSVI